MRSALAGCARGPANAGPSSRQSPPTRTDALSTPATAMIDRKDAKDNHVRLCARNIAPKIAHGPQTYHVKRCRKLAVSILDQFESDQMRLPLKDLAKDASWVSRKPKLRDG